MPHNGRPAGPSPPAKGNSLRGAGAARGLEPGLSCPLGREAWPRARNFLPHYFQRSLLEVRCFTVFISFSSDNPVRQPCFLDHPRFVEEAAEAPGTRRGGCGIRADAAHDTPGLAKFVLKRRIVNILGWRASFGFCCMFFFFITTLSKPFLAHRATQNRPQVRGGPWATLRRPVAYM